MRQLWPSHRRSPADSGSWLRDHERWNACVREPCQAVAKRELAAERVVGVLEHVSGHKHELRMFVESDSMTSFHAGMWPREGTRSPRRAPRLPAQKRAVDVQVSRVHETEHLGPPLHERLALPHSARRQDKYQVRTGDMEGRCQALCVKPCPSHYAARDGTQWYADSLDSAVPFRHATCHAHKRRTQSNERSTRVPSGVRDPPVNSTSCGRTSATRRSRRRASYTTRSPTVPDPVGAHRTESIDILTGSLRSQARRVSS